MQFELCIDYLREHGSNDTLDQSECCKILESIKTLLQLKISGQTVYQATIFSEFIDVIDRIISLKGDDKRLLAIDITVFFYISYSNCTSEQSYGDTSYIEQIYDLVRITAIILFYSCPWLKERDNDTQGKLRLL
jgi:hypothetical protein